MAESLARRISTTDVKALIGGLAQTNHYLVNFSSLRKPIYDYLARFTGRSDIKTFLGRKAGILCNEASLPTSRMASGVVKDSFMGVPQEYAHTRLYNDIDFTFYVDQDYTLLKVFEGWMEYISSGANAWVGQENSSYYRRMRYPDSYKVDSMYIRKFERGHESQLKYRFINAYPKQISPLTVSYAPAEVLKVNVTFNYDRYVVF